MTVVTAVAVPPTLLAKHEYGPLSLLVTEGMMCVTFAVPIRVTTGPRVLLSMIHCTLAGASVCTVHQRATLEPERTSTVAGAVTVGDSKRKELSCNNYQGQGQRQTKTQMKRRFGDHLTEIVLQK